MYIQGVSTGRYIHGLLEVTVYIHGLLEVIVYIHGVLEVGRYIHGLLEVTVYIQGLSTVGRYIHGLLAVTVYIHGLEWAGVAYIHGRPATGQELVNTTSERTWPLLAWPGDAAATVPSAANTRDGMRIPRVALVRTVVLECSRRALLADPTVGVITCPNDLAVSIERSPHG